MNPQTQIMVKNFLMAKLRELKLKIMLKGKENMLAYAGINKERLMKPFDSSVLVKYVYKNKENIKKPTSVQQNVPAWLLLSMYLIVIPVASTFIIERNHGTIIRLKSMNVSGVYFLSAKYFPYYLINMIQVILMLLMGVFIVPLLGGESLNLGDSFLGLFLISSCASFNAISLALLISAFVTTVEQAAAIGGFGTIILGAIGGIMVPKFVMPEFMQKLTNISPMSWGLEGFLDIFLREGNFFDVINESLLLVISGFFMLFLAIFVIKRKFSQ